MATHVPYMPDPTPQYAVGSVVPIVVRIIYEPGQSHDSAFPMTVYANGLWTESTGQQLSVNHAIIVVLNHGDVVADASGNFTRPNGEVCEWVEYRYDLDTAIHPTPSVDYDGNAVNFGATWAAGVYDMCVMFNGAHHGTSTVEDAKRAWNYGSVRSRFILTPFGDTLYEDLPERVTLHRRTAGEKAIFDDEFVTKGQLEAGIGVDLIYRDDFGATISASYTTVAAQRMHVIFEAKGIEATYVDLYDNETVYAQVWTRKFRFKDTPDNRLTLTPQGATGTFDSPTMQIEIQNVQPFFVVEAYKDNIAASPVTPPDLYPDAFQPDDFVSTGSSAGSLGGARMMHGSLHGIGFAGWGQKFDTFWPRTGTWTADAWVEAKWDKIPVDWHISTNDIGQTDGIILHGFLPENRFSALSHAGAMDYAGTVYNTPSYGILSNGGNIVPANNINVESIDNTQFILFGHGSCFNEPDIWAGKYPDFESLPVNNYGEIHFYISEMELEPTDTVKKRRGIWVRGFLDPLWQPKTLPHGQWEWAAAANGAFNVGAIGAGGSGNRMPILGNRYTGGEGTFMTNGIAKIAPESGWYWYQCVVAGEHVNNGAAYPLARYDLFLQIAKGVEPNGQLEQQLSNMVWIDYDPNLATQIDAGGAVLTMLDSIPWSLNGSGRIWLEAGQPVSFSVLLKGAGAWAVAASRVFYFRYARFELKLISTDPAQFGDQNRDSYVGFGSNAGNWMNYTLRP